MTMRVNPVKDEEQETHADKCRFQSYVGQKGENGA